MWGDDYPVSEIQERLSQGVSVSRVFLFAVIKSLRYHIMCGQRGAEMANLISES